MKEQVLEVRKWGNGAGILLPREWLGEKVVVTIKPKIPIKEQILEILTPYLENIIGAYLYGSRARGDAIEGSDIDLFLITDKKLDIYAKGFEINVFEKKYFPLALTGLSALVTYSMLAEAKPIINSGLLEELRKKFVPKLSDFEYYIQNTKKLIKKQKEGIELDKKLNELSTIYSDVAYSLILRLRGVYLINCLLTKKAYKKQDFDDWVVEYSNIKDYKSVYSSYLSVKNDKREKHKLLISDLALLNNLLIREISKMEAK